MKENMVEQQTFCFGTHRNNSRAGRELADTLWKDVRVIISVPPNTLFHSSLFQFGRDMSLSLMNINALLTIIKEVMG